MESFDYVIVGSGSAGAIIAARLSADPACRVLLLEAGPRDRGLIFRVPAAARYAFNARRYNWNYETDPEPTLGGRRIKQPRGRVLGGSSSINGLIYLRGHALDYEGWAQAGARGWSYAETLPYFRRLETGVDPASAYQGREGPVKIATVDRLNPLGEAFFRACAEAGYGATEDVNGYRQDGFGRVPMNAGRGLRWSTSRAYLDEAEGRSNLTVRTGCTADRIVIEKGRAVALAYRRAGLAQAVRAEREIILSAGAYNSPKLLLLSGIGPADHLREIGIDLVHDLPGVGRNLMDHPIVAIQLRCREPVSLYRRMDPFSKSLGALSWLLRRDGLLASNHFETGAFLRSRAGIRFPDIQLNLLAIAVAVGSKAFAKEHSFQIQITLQRPLSRGWVKLRSADPDDGLSIRFNTFEEAQDLVDLRRGFRLTREILAQPAFQAFGIEEFIPGPSVESDEAIAQYLRESVDSSYHPCGTCKMGEDAMAVIAPDCRVHGLESLRVADASIMPAIPSCNLNCPTMMIGEKAADLIAGRAPLPPSNLPYYSDPEWPNRQREGCSS